MTIEPSFPNAAFVPVGRFAALPRVQLGRPLTLLGSSEQAHVRLRSRSIAPLHALVLNVDGRVIIRNLSAGLKFKVNHQPIRHAELKAGDEVRIGPARFVFEPGIAVGEVGLQPPLAQQLWDANGLVKSVDGPIAVLGGEPDADICISESPLPIAVMMRIGPRHIVRQLDPAQELRLNDKPVHQTILRPGDVIEAAGKRFQFAAPPLAAEAPVPQEPAEQTSPIVAADGSIDAPKLCEPGSAADATDPQPSSVEPLPATIQDWGPLARALFWQQQSIRSAGVVEPLVAPEIPRTTPPPRKRMRFSIAAVVAMMASIGAWLGFR